jgi:S1-C subfamily serine protease
MKRKILALFCAAAILLAVTPAASALTGEQTRAADTLYTLGLVRGNASGDPYSLSNPATRAAAAIMLVRLAGGEAAAARDPWISGFLDAPAWLQPALNYASYRKWITGVTPIRFAPGGNVTANAYCAFLLRMLGYSDAGGDFTVSGAAVFARHIGLVSQTYSGDLTRGDLFEISASALTFRYRNSTETVVDRLISGGTVTRSSASALGLLDIRLTARQVADRCMAAVFTLEFYADKDSDKKAAETPSSYSSGFFISSDGLAVTNYHAIDGETRATACLSTGERYDVERVIGYNPKMDLAVLRISTVSQAGKAASAFAYLDIAESDDLRAGDTVYTIGNPLSLGLAVSSGIISDPIRAVEGYQLPLILNTADISQGSSGGALLNEYGQVIGVTTGAFVFGNNMYLAVPASAALSLDLTGSGQTLAEVARLTAKQ